MRVTSAPELPVSATGPSAPTGGTNPSVSYAASMTTFPRFDVDRVRLKHYRSIAGCDVMLGPMTLLVGPNGSGKSNFVDSLRLVAQALSENLDNALRERGGIAEVRRRSPGHPTHFSISLNFSWPGGSGSYSFQVGSAKGGEYRVSHEDCRIARAEFGSDDVWFSVRNGSLVGSSLGTMPSVSSDRLYLVAASGFEDFRPVFDGLSAINVYNLNPDAMRRPQNPDAGELLRRDGANVASVLERLHRQLPDVKTRIQEYLQLIVPGIESVDRRGYGAWESMEFRQKVAGSTTPWNLPATSMSDGTLRALGVLVALFAAAENGYSPIGIEEPEGALHPAAAGLLLEALRAASESRQVIATSHSPDLLDSDAVTSNDLLAVRADSGTTTIGRLDRASAAALRERLYTAGELLRLDQLIPDPAVGQRAALFS